MNAFHQSRMARMFYSLCFVILLLAFSQSLCSVSKDPHVKNRSVLKVVDSLEKLVEFYVENFDKVNLDSIYGLRIAEGFLMKIVEEFNVVNSLQNRHLQKIKSLLRTMTWVANQSLPHLKEYQSDYYIKFKPIVDKPWRFFEDFKRIKHAYPKHSVSNDKSLNGKSFDERRSDHCMTEMIGTAVLQKQPCHVSSSCLDLMTSKELKRYGNTHQVLYFLIGYQMNCRNIMERELVKSPEFVLRKENVSSVDKFLEEKCGQILYEMKDLEPNVASKHETDLFLEQGLVCAILGFKEFLSLDILQNIFRWQDAELGCFGTMTSPAVDHPKEEKFIEPNRDYDARRFVSRITMRKLLYDRTLENGCSSHETGVATGLLSIYLRWLLSSNP